MSFYYSANIFLCWLSLGVLSLHVHDNARITKRDKRLLYLTYTLIALSALAEYSGVYFDGREEYPSCILSIIKCADYILTPMAGGAMVTQINLKSRWKNLLTGLLVFNTVLQVLSATRGWMVTIDEHNHYSHGKLYTLYIGIYMFIILIVLFQFIAYSRSFCRQNRVSLYATMLLIVSGIMIQEMSGREARTSYIALTLGAMLLFIHYTEYVSLEMDDYVKRQQVQLDTDALTGVFSRLAFSHMLKLYDQAESIPGDLAVFTIDINGLKQVNDSLGHEAGDELISGAAACIVKALDASGQCYRTGGDEFVVLTAMSKDQAESALERLKLETDHWHGSLVKALSLSAGYALAEEYDKESLTVEMLVRESDKAMYVAKAAYYRNKGQDRRSRRR